MCLVIFSLSRAVLLLLFVEFDFRLTHSSPTRDRSEAGLWHYGGHIKYSSIQGFLLQPELVDHSQPSPSTPKMELLGVLRVGISPTLDRRLGEYFVDFGRLSLGEYNVSGRDVLHVAFLVSV